MTPASVLLIVFSVLISIFSLTLTMLSRYICKQGRNRFTVPAAADSLPTDQLSAAGNPHADHHGDPDVLFTPDFQSALARLDTSAKGEIAFYLSRLAKEWSDDREGVLSRSLKLERGGYRIIFYLNNKESSLVFATRPKEATSQSEASGQSSHLVLVDLLNARKLPDGYSIPDLDAHATVFALYESEFSLTPREEGLLRAANRR